MQRNVGTCSLRFALLQQCVHVTATHRLHVLMSEHSLTVIVISL
jgi:hypothetical protein